VGGGGGREGGMGLRGGGGETLQGTDIRPGYGGFFPNDVTHTVGGKENNATEDA